MRRPKTKDFLAPGTTRRDTTEADVKLPEPMSGVPAGILAESDIEDRGSLPAREIVPIWTTYITCEPYPYGGGDVDSSGDGEDLTLEELVARVAGIAAETMMPLPGISGLYPVW